MYHMHFRDPLSKMIWWNENLSLLRRGKVRRTDHFRFTKMLKLCASFFSSITIRTERKRFFVESNFSSISKLTHLRFAVCLFFLCVYVSMLYTVQYVIFILCQPNDIWNTNASRLTVHFVQIFDVQCLFFSMDVMPRLKYMNCTHTFWCMYICILSKKNMVIIWQKITNNKTKCKMYYIFDCDFVVEAMYGDDAYACIQRKRKAFENTLPADYTIGLVMIFLRCCSYACANWADAKFSIFLCRNRYVFFLVSRISYRSVIYEMCDLWISLT